jgi:hypothetical protein
MTHGDANRGHFGEASPSEAARPELARVFFRKIENAKTREHASSLGLATAFVFAPRSL